MPTYGYQCTTCENAFEIVQKMTDPALSTCDACGGALRKKIFPVGIAFKGSGFYVNDYSRSGGESAKSEAASADAKPAADAAKTDSAPDAKSDTAAPAAAPASPAASASESKPAAAAPAAPAAS
jgi:putative FmdB family regulatory protein